MGLRGPATVVMYRVVYNETSASFAWWDGSDWTPTGNVHSIEDIHKQLEYMGATLAFKESLRRMVKEIWTIGG